MRFHSYRARLQAVLVLLGLAAIALTGWEASAGASAALRQATHDRLTAIRESRAHALERYFQDLGSHVLALSADDSVLRALEDFSGAWRGLPAPGTREREAVRAYYREFGPVPDAWFPRHAGTIALQHLFLAANPHPVGAKDRLLEAPGAYGRVHARFHPTLHRYQTAFGFHDIFLIDAAEARVLYTVFKEPDLGAHLRESPYRESPLGKIYQRALELKEPEQFVLADYEPYVPSHSARAAFAAAPVWRAGEKAGVLAIQVTAREVDSVMITEELGATGRAYIESPRKRELPEGIATAMGQREVPVVRSRGTIEVPGLDWAVVAEIEEDEAFAPVRALRNRIFGIGAVIAAGLWFAAALLARSVTRPVLRLAEGARQLGTRNFDVRLPVTSDDEIGRLAGDFNRMAEALERTTVSKDELQKLAGRLITAQEDERSRVARELHDDLTQRLAALAIDAGRLGAKSLESGLARLSDDVHRISRSLHPAMLDDLGLAAAVESECRNFFDRGGAPVDFTARGDFGRLSRDARLALFRITQEALRNILRHAAAEEVAVTLSGSGHEVTLEVRDNGRGFDRDSAEWRAGLGLASMEERVRLLGGRIEIESVPGKGTTIRACLPAPESSSPTTTAS